MVSPVENHPEWADEYLNRDIFEEYNDLIETELEVINDPDILALFAQYKHVMTGVGALPPERAIQAPLLIARFIAYNF